MRKAQEHLHNGWTIRLITITTSFALTHLISFSVRHSELACTSEMVEVWDLYSNAQDTLVFMDGPLEMFVFYDVTFNLMRLSRFELVLIFQVPSQPSSFLLTIAPWPHYIRSRYNTGIDTYTCPI